MYDSVCFCRSFCLCLNTTCRLRCFNLCCRATYQNHATRRDDESSVTGGKYGECASKSEKHANIVVVICCCWTTTMIFILKNDMCAAYEMNLYTEYSLMHFKMTTFYASMHTFYFYFKQTAKKAYCFKLELEVSSNWKLTIVLVVGSCLSLINYLLKKENKVMNLF